MIAGGVSGSFTVATTSANQAPVFTGDPNLGAVAFPWNASIAVAATDADADTITYAIDLSSATIWPFLSIDADTGAISVDRALVETDAFAANPQIAFTVTATDDRAAETAANPGDPDQGALTTAKAYTMDLGLPADCDALLAAIPGLTDGPAGIDPRLIPGAGVGVDGPIQTWCDVDIDPADGMTPVAWTMVAAFPSAPQGGTPRAGNTVKALSTKVESFRFHRRGLGRYDRLLHMGLRRSGRLATGPS